MSRRIAAVYMRGGTSKGVFFHARDLPRSTRERDALLLRVVGSPDPYGRHTDGMGGATSSTSKVVLIAPSTRDDCDVDYLFGAVSIGEPLIDWSGNCGNLSAAVGPFAISEGLVAPVDGLTRVRIWQLNIGQRIDAFVPVRHGEVLEDGAFMEDGVPFPGAEVRLEFLEPGHPAQPDAEAVGFAALLPTGAPQDELSVPGLGRLRATMITAGNPTVFVRADALGLSGRELPDDVNRRRGLLAQLEAIRAAAAVRMGLADSAAFATAHRPATPKVSWVARPAGYRTSAGAEVTVDRIDVLARIVSMGRLHHAFTGTGSIALAAAAALPGTVVSEVARTLPGVPTRIGHVSGVLTVGAEVSRGPGGWRFDKAVLSRSARRLMSGWVHLPGSMTGAPAGVGQSA
ncbi:MAG: 2-methylaconitate cis-trans isomerase PrpF [Burkholderiaceae bacterium]|nr:2-methylaconitate cis-trans isomerase PrpF [Burkholderiaceae bacterium]